MMIFIPVEVDQGFKVLVKLHWKKSLLKLCNLNAYICAMWLNLETLTQLADLIMYFLKHLYKIKK